MSSKQFTRQCSMTLIMMAEDDRVEYPTFERRVQVASSDHEAGSASILSMWISDLNVDRLSRVFKVSTSNIVGLHYIVY